MNAVWNLPMLERPPCVTWQIKPLEAKKRGLNVTRFKTILGTASHDLESMDDLHINAAVLSRLIYRMKCKFRSDKGLRYMIKLNRALLNYHSMSLNKDYATLRSQIQMEDGMYILPSRQSLEYVLARTQGFGKLMTRIEEMSKCASHLLKARMELGHAWKIALMAYATTSRIWFHAKSTIKKCCKWYDELYQCTQQFQYVGVKPWLPENQTLPCNLKSWLCLDWQDTDMIYNQNSQTWQKVFGEFSTEVYDDTKVTFVIPKQEMDSSMLDEKTDSSRLTQIVDVASNNNMLEDKPVSNTDIDIGEVIDRKAFERNLPNDRLTTKRKHLDTERKNLKESRKKRKGSNTKKEN